MTYERFASVYDVLMKDVPYPEWVQFLERKLASAAIEGKRVLDLGCGTGELSVMLAKTGYDVTGVDLSSDMLMIAQQKAEIANVEISLFEQDMSKLEDLGVFDIVTIFCDSLNYLSTPEQVRDTFKGVNQHLKGDGLFLFDVHSLYKIEQIFMNATFALAEEEIAYIWDCFPGEHEYSVEHELTFFLQKNGSEMYERFEELHKQRTFPVQVYTKWLLEAGFSVLSITADFSENSPTEKSERIFFACQKK